MLDATAPVIDRRNDTAQPQRSAAIDGAYHLLPIEILTALGQRRIEARFAIPWHSA